MERRYEMEEWNQGTQESLGNVPVSQKLKSEAGLSKNGCFISPDL